MSKIEKKTATIQTKKGDIVFNKDVSIYDMYINEMALDNKVAPAKEYLRRSVLEDSKELLEDYLARGYHQELAGQLTQAIKPDEEFILKK